MTADINGVSLYYEEKGEGKPLLLLHGWGGSGESFLPLTRDLSPARRVIALDFPGHGKTGEPPCPWSVTEYTEMTRAFIEKTGIAPCDILAHSFGGRVALLLAARHPESIGKMLLTGCAGIPPKPSGKKTAKSRVYSVLKKAADNAATRKILGDRTTDALREGLIQRFGSSDYRALTPSMRQTFNRVIGQDLSWTLPQIQTETLLVWGENDTATPLWMGQKMEKEIKDAALIVFPNRGHFAYLEEYDRFRAIAWKYFVG